jgi:hypothetical protein
VQIAMLAGDVAGDALGGRGVTALGNNNYVIASSSDDEGGIVNAGSVRLMNGATGAQIAILAGDTANDSLGNRPIVVLDNNNYVIVSSNDEENLVSNAGSVRLMNGATGAPIAMLTGDVANDQLGNTSVTALGNNNYVIASFRDDEGGIVDAGSVRLVNGTSGVQIAILAGDEANDFLGYHSVTALGNQNYVIASESDTEGGILDAGSVRLMNGTTGAAIGAAIVGATARDVRDALVVKPVDGDYYTLSQPFADIGGQADAGRVRIVVP